MAGDRYYRVSPAFWADHPHWDDDQRLLALYILTCPHRTTEGLFRMPLAYAQADLKWPEKRFSKAFDQLVVDGFVEYDDHASLCLIVKALKWQAPSVVNHITHAVRNVMALPSSPLRERFGTLCALYAPGLADAIADAMANDMPHGTANGKGHSQAQAPSLRGVGGGMGRSGRDERPLTDLGFSEVRDR